MRHNFPQPTASSHMHDRHHQYVARIECQAKKHFTTSPLLMWLDARTHSICKHHHQAMLQKGIKMSPSGQNSHSTPQI